MHMEASIAIFLPAKIEENKFANYLPFFLTARVDVITIGLIISNIDILVIIKAFIPCNMKQVRSYFIW